MSQNSKSEELAKGHVYLSLFGRTYKFAHIARIWLVRCVCVYYQTKTEAQVTSPTACGALFSACTTPQPSQNLAEPWCNLGGTLVEPYLRAVPDHPEPIWAETPKLSAVEQFREGSEQGGRQRGHLGQRGRPAAGRQGAGRGRIVRGGHPAAVREPQRAPERWPWLSKPFGDPILVGAGECTTHFGRDFSGWIG